MNQKMESKNRSSTPRLPRELKFGMQAYINQTRKNMNKKNWGHQTTTLTPRKKIGLSLKLAALCNLGSIQAKAYPSIAWARLFIFFYILNIHTQRSNAS